MSVRSLSGVIAPKGLVSGTKGKGPLNPSGQGTRTASQRDFQVPSLGNCIDTFLDAFHYSREDIINIHFEFRKSSDIRDFAERLPRILACTPAQAEWMYTFIERKNAVRVRSVDIMN